MRSSWRQCEREWICAANIEHTALHSEREWQYPLAAFVDGLRQDGSVELPDFDSLDGGIHACILFLLEKPGPMTAKNGKRNGSGFISRDDNDATAASHS